MNFYVICFARFQKILEMETEPDKPNVYHESHRFVSQVLGAVLVQLCSKFITWVPLWMFKHTNGVIAEVEGDNEHPLFVNWIGGHQLSTEIQHITL